MKMTEGIEGSLFSTYAYTSSILALDKPPANSIKRLSDVLSEVEGYGTGPVDAYVDEMKKKRFVNEPGIPYYPFLSAESRNGRGDNYLKSHIIAKRASSGRAVPFQLALFINDTSNRDAHRARMIRNLEIFEKNAPALMWHTNRNSTHGIPGLESDESDGLAPYYFYPAIPYATAALKILINDPNMTAADRNKLEGIQNKLRDKLLWMLGPKDLFRPQGKEFYHSSPAYVNPLAGLALIPLVDECKGKKAADSFGILRKNDLQKISSRSNKSKKEDKNLTESH